MHGNGVNMDDYETHDDRRLLAGSGFTIEPGVYFDDFGVRTEINMVVAPRDAAVTGPRQTEIAGTRLGGSMSTRKTTLFYALLLMTASLVVGMVIASRLDLAPRSSAQTHCGAGDEQRADHRPARRADIPQHRQAGARRWSSTSAPR